MLGGLVPPCPRTGRLLDLTARASLFALVLIVLTCRCGNEPIKALACSISLYNSFINAWFVLSLVLKKSLTLSNVALILATFLLSDCSLSIFRYSA